MCVCTACLSGSLCFGWYLAPFLCCEFTNVLDQSLSCRIARDGVRVSVRETCPQRSSAHLHYWEQLLAQSVSCQTYRASMWHSVLDDTADLACPDRVDKILQMIHSKLCQSYEMVLPSVFFLFGLAWGGFLETLLKLFLLRLAAALWLRI